MTDEILARVEASAPRRYLAVGMQGVLGALLLYIALTMPPAFGWQIFLIALAGFSFWSAVKMWEATAGALVLTREALFEENGPILARIDDIAKVDRGAFAFKPSNGFMIKTETPQPRGWRPGMWWRLGRRLAIGGVMPGSQTKPMADIIAALKIEALETSGD